MSVSYKIPLVEVNCSTLNASKNKSGKYYQESAHLCVFCDRNCDSPRILWILCPLRIELWRNWMRTPETSFIRDSSCESTSSLLILVASCGIHCLLAFKENHASSLNANISKKARWRVGTHLTIACSDKVQRHQTATLYAEFFDQLSQWTFCYLNADKWRCGSSQWLYFSFIIR